MERPFAQPDTASSSVQSGAARKETTSGTQSTAVGSPPLDPKGLLDELTDADQLGNRGEWWFAAQCLAIFLIVVPPAALEGVIDVLGPLLLLTGFGFMVLGQQVLGNNLSPLPTPREQHQLMTSGIYGYIRHPMYGGLILAGLGLAATTHNEVRLAMVGLLWWVLEQKVEFEEEKLGERYPEYGEYKIKTKKFVPYIY